MKLIYIKVNLIFIKFTSSYRPISRGRHVLLYLKITLILNCDVNFATCVFMAILFGLLLKYEQEGKMFLRNVGELLPDYTALH
jgi:hypothetical protein